MNRAPLDTDIDSEVLKGRDPDVARNTIAYRALHGALTLSVVSVAEIVGGLQRVGSTRRIQAFFQAIDLEEVLPCTRGAAVLAGRIAGDLERTGQTIGLADAMIAAIALEDGLELVTGNQAHFQRIPPLDYPLILANWRGASGQSPQPP